MGVWSGGRVRIAAKKETDGPVRVVQDIDADRPLYCTAVGKPLAAWLPAAEVAAALDRTPMLPRTAKTITDRATFEAELRSAKASLELDMVPRTSPTCRAVFCDADCGANPARFTHLLAVNSVDLLANSVGFAGAPAAAEMQGGWIKWIDGPLAAAPTGR